MLAVQGNLALTYQKIGRLEEALRVWEDVYSGELILYGAEHEQPLISANNHANCLMRLHRFKEAKSILRRSMAVARRVLGESHELTLKMRWIYAETLYKEDNATLDDLREAVTTGEEIERIARRVFGGAHPLALDIERSLHNSRVRLAARPV